MEGSPKKEEHEEYVNDSGSPIDDATFALIIEHWFRVLLPSPSSIVPISSIISAFGRQIEVFKADQCHPLLAIEAEGAILQTNPRNSKETVYSVLNGFGSFTATRGRVYHWKLKMIKMEDSEIQKEHL